MPCLPQQGLQRVLAFATHSSLDRTLLTRQPNLETQAPTECFLNLRTTLSEHLSTYHSVNLYDSGQLGISGSQYAACKC